MKTKSTLAAVCVLICLLAAAPVQATFSIVAVDTVNGIVGGAGASCIDNAQIINDIIESVGAVHTQALWLAENQQNAHLLLNQGLTPDSIIGWLVANDAYSRPQDRQYGVVTLNGPGASAGHTGAANTPWAGHITGPGYAIQGNILLGPEIITDMEAAFLGTDGPLEKKLMAALEAAKVVGADTRCTPYNKSSISAFVKVVRPGDGVDPFLYEVVPNTTGSTDPIDLLRIQFDNWKLAQSAHPDSSTITITPAVLEADGAATAVVTITPLDWDGQTPVQIDSVLLTNSGDGTLSAVTDNGDGTFSATLTAPATPGEDELVATVGAYYDYVTELNTRPAVTYYLCGDVTGSGTGPNVDDLSFLVSYLFRSGPAPAILAAADMTGDGSINVNDLTYLVSYIFKGGPAPICE